MHPYSIDTEERKNVFLFLGVISIVSAWGFHKMFGYYKVDLPWWTEPPSLLFFYGSLFIVFDKWLWRIFKKMGFIQTPNFSGEWSGHLKSSFDESLETKATLRIYQTWTKIKILLNTDQSLSHSESASVVINTPEGAYLSYQYLNEPKPNAVKTMSIHRGTTRLLFKERENMLIGEYYSGRDRQNYGSLNFKRR